MMRIFLLSLFFVTFLWNLGYSQVATDSVRVYYRQGYRTVDLDYMNNRSELERFMQVVRKAYASGRIDRLVIRSYASPDGLNKSNERLAVNRAEWMEIFICQQTGVPDTCIVTRAEGIAWGMLREMVAASGASYRDEVLHILDRVPVWEYDAAGRVVGGRKKRLMELRGGVPYREMLGTLFPALRSSLALSLYMKTTNKADSVGMVAGDGSVEVADEELKEGTGGVEENAGDEYAGREESADEGMEDGVDESMVISSSVQRLVVKTNLLYDAALMPNVEVEWLFHPRWSVSVEADVAWWKRDSKHKYYQVWAISPECRYWFWMRAPWHGQYVGLMAGGGAYDLENGHTGYRGEAGFVGATYGFMWPIGRRLSFDAEAGVGYMHMRYKEYEPLDGHYAYKRTRRMNYVGPIKLKFSIAWRFWNVDDKKGGAK